MKYPAFLQPASLKKTLPVLLRQPTSLALLASLGVHGALLVVFPILAASSNAEIDSSQRTVNVVQLNPLEESRLPDVGNSPLNLPPLTPSAPKAAQGQGKLPDPNPPTQSSSTLDDLYRLYGLNPNASTNSGPIVNGAPPPPPTDWTSLFPGTSTTQPPTEKQKPPSEDATRSNKPPTPKESSPPTERPTANPGSRNDRGSTPLQPGQPGTSTQTGGSTSAPPKRPSDAIAHNRELQESIRESITYDPSGLAPAKISGNLSAVSDDFKKTVIKKLGGDDASYNSQTVGTPPSKPITISDLYPQQACRYNLVLGDKSSPNTVVGVAVGPDNQPILEPQIVRPSGYGILDKTAKQYAADPDLLKGVIRRKEDEKGKYLLRFLEFTFDRKNCPDSQKAQPTG